MAQGATARGIDQAGERMRDAAEDGWQGLQPVLDYEIVRFAGLDLTVGGLVAAALLLLFAFVGSKIIARLLCRFGERSGASAAAVYTVTRIVHYALLALGVLLALEAAGIPMSRFAVFAGAIGVGLGFGLQAIFSNFISGLILLFDRSIKIGDFVELESGVQGQVRDIKIRATRISTNDNLDILVPNSEFVSGRVVNWTLVETSRRMRVPFGVAYGTDKEVVKKAALEAAREVPFTLAQEGPRGPQVWLTEFGDSSLVFELIVWLNADATKRPSAVKAAYNWALHTALQRHAIEIPFPQRDLHVRSLFGHGGAEAFALVRGEAAAVDEPVRPEAAPPTEHERAALSQNDAQRDVEIEIRVEPGTDLPVRGDAPRNEEK